MRVLVCAALLLAACGTPGARTARPAPPAAVVRPTADPSLAALEGRINARIARETGRVAVALADLGTGLRLEVNASASMHAASTMKVPVMLEVFRQADAGMLSLDDRIPITNQFRSIVEDSVFTLSANADSEMTLYDRIGGNATVRELVGLMIVRSSNLALNLLIDRVGAARVMETLSSIGAEEMVVRRGVEDGPAFRRGLNNTTTAHGFVTVLEAIGRCTLMQRSACDEMIDILAAQEFDEMIPAGLPPGTRVADKRGWITGIEHDGGIVFPPGRPPYVLVVLTSGFTDRTTAHALAADISRLVWEQLTAASFSTAVRPTDPPTRALLELHTRHRVGEISQRHFGHAQLWRALDPYLTGPVRREQIGHSGEGRSIHLLRYGQGPTRVLLWSQMHGDESTATMALTDLVRFLHESAGEARAARWAERLTILMIPMLNPDGAERFERHNAFGIDVNRDARALATPEAQTLKAVRDRFSPMFGFNLHDQNPRTRVGASSRLAAIALLAPPVDANATATLGFILAEHVAATIRESIEPLVGGHITRYDDSFNPRAFGDLMQQWGTSTVLIESGGWRMDPEKQYLRAVNFVALVSALDAIAADTFRNTPVDVYETLPANARAVNDLLIRGGTLVLGGPAPVRADVAVDFEGGTGRPLRTRIVEVGDLDGVQARDTLGVPGLFLHAVSSNGAVLTRLSPGMDATFDVRAGTAPTSELVFRIERGVRRAPDARR